MLDGLSDLSLYFRFQTAVTHPPRPSIVDPLVRPNGAAWVAESADGVIGHSMWAWAYGTADPVAELAVVVSEPHQGNGIGLHLVTAAAAHAAAAGATRFLFVVSAANDRMLRMIRRYWPNPEVERDGALLNFLVPAVLPGLV
jgi:GNAT superfamily N-acetyltransferase